MASSSPDAIPQLLTPKDVAEALQVSVRTVRRLIAAGDLKVIRVGSSVRISPAAFDNYVTAAVNK